MIRALIALAAVAGLPHAASAEISSGSGAISQPAASNRLIHETSPYLLQHAHNPVDWFPWSDEAFAKAKRENKPVFLSVGYSTCYWCHVMEKESFEDAEVARILNERFVAIKVDREERPEIDEHYLLATQVLTGKGGWPNSVWLTPEGAPWLASTYLPKAKFITLLNRASDRWTSRRAEVNRQVVAVAAELTKAERVSLQRDAASPLSGAFIDRAMHLFLRDFDQAHGGFGGAPKFPPHGALAFLLRQCAVSDDPALRNVVTKTLDAMWLGGLHDHVGGGFHRYATDARWLVPHFEKMLYDNAQLMRAYTDGYRLTGHTRYREAVEDIFSWAEREMTSPEGAFYSAIDAGEVEREGAAYVWRRAQVSEVLGAVDGSLFAEIYRIEAKGNFVEEVTRKRGGTNIPFLSRPIEEIARLRGENLNDLATRLASMRAKLLAHRRSWPQPRRDDKVIASWNGLMIGALAHAGHELQEPRYLAAATRAADFLRRTMIADGTLRRTFRAGEARLPGYLEDYALVAAGFLELHRASGDRVWLGQAEQLARVIMADFQDEHDGGFFFTGTGRDERILRAKNLRGSSNQPDPAGVAAGVLLDLGRRTGNSDYTAAAKHSLESLAARLHHDPVGSEHALMTAADYLRDSARSAADIERSTAGPKMTERVDAVTIRVDASRTRVAPGESIEVTVSLDIDPGWHLYGENPSASFVVPASVSCDETGPLIVQSLDRPKAQPMFDPVLRQTVNLYRGRIGFGVNLTAETAAPAGEVTLLLRIVTQACDDSRCLPVRTTMMRLPLSIAPEASVGSR